MSCACGGSCTERDRPVGDEAGSKARREVRLLAARFIAASILFGAGLAVTLADGPVPAIRILFVLSWLAAGYRVVFSALRNIARGQVFDENFLMSTATVGAFLIGQWSEGAAVMLFYNLGEMVQESAVNRSRRSISELMDVRPDFARLVDGNREVHPSAVPTGSLILVKPGEKVPLDGIVVDGISSFDTSRLTGESIPRDVLGGDEALAGFVNGSGLLTVRTTALYADTAASKMLELIENAQNRKAKAEKLITSFARIYTPIVTVGAVLIAFIPPLVLSVAGGVPLEGWSSFYPWVSRALVFLVISCPCAFVISVPLGFFGGIGGAARLGVLVKGADFIDVLAKARAVVFDKTGTLTRGVFRVQSVEGAGEGQYTDRYVTSGASENHYTDRYVTSLAATAEFHSNHPVARAIRTYAADAGIAVDESLMDAYTESAGYGVSMLHDGIDLRAGSRKFMVESGVTGLPEPSGEAGTTVEISHDLAYKGRIILNDEPKTDSTRAVTELHALGIREIVMISGDTDVASRDIARKIGITEVHSGILPHRKVSLFEEISVRVKAAYPKGTVLFVGDGINDAPVLARADGGIAMGGIGSDAAIEAADIVLMNDNPLSVAEAIRSARWTRHIVMENIVLSFVIKIGFLALGAAGIATLWEAVFADVGVALLATVNSLRARSLPRRPEPK